ncbi:hypothetical protein F2Q70_00013850 [Brassica cretica]|uniref:Uncharacterized protein n=1 Tax=Brassica cretica TaxID=69181 RepID=A0A8S9LZ85_BRACR|nr:hypothetical protein F2Q70_00013850 [Brassica cretica]
MSMLQKIWRILYISFSDNSSDINLNLTEGYTVKSKLHLLTSLSEDKVKQCVDPKLKGEWSQHKLVAKFYEINCAAYGTVAEKLYENWFSSTAKVVVCVLQLWQIEWGEGCLSYITNFEECLDNLFDPRIP